MRTAAITKPVPKDKIEVILATLKKIELEAPVFFNQVVLKNILGTGIDVVTSGYVDRQDMLKKCVDIIE